MDVVVGNDHDTVVGDPLGDPPTALDDGQDPSLVLVREGVGPSRGGVPEGLDELPRRFRSLPAATGPLDDQPSQEIPHSPVGRILPVFPGGAGVGDDDDPLLVHEGVREIDLRQLEPEDLLKRRSPRQRAFLQEGLVALLQSPGGDSAQVEEVIPRIVLVVGQKNRPVLGSPFPYGHGETVLFLLGGQGGDQEKNGQKREKLFHAPPHSPGP